jgi:hypothetical protein
MTAVKPNVLKMLTRKIHYEPQTSPEMAQNRQIYRANTLQASIQSNYHGHRGETDIEVEVEDVEDIE